MGLKGFSFFLFACFAYNVRAHKDHLVFTLVIIREDYWRGETVGSFMPCTARHFDIKLLH